MGNDYVYNLKDKKILTVVGNGFDLYHDLPTKFEDFVNFIKNCNIIMKPYHDNNNPRNENNERFIFEFNRNNFISSYSEFMKNGKFDPEYIIPLSNFHNKLNKENGNFFFKYFDLQKPKPDIAMNWNNFEMELYEILSTINEYYVNSLSYLMNKSYFITLLNDRFKNKKEAIDYILKEFIEFRKHFNIYLDQFVNHVLILKYSNELFNLTKHNKCDALSFNYTDLGLYKFYKFNKEIYIHGRSSVIKENNVVHKNYLNNDLVIGIPDNSFPGDLDYIEFQKYFQRIMHNTETIDINAINSYDEFFLFGHSLHKLDATILKMIFDRASNKCKVNIFYRLESDKKKKILNILDWYDKERFIELNNSHSIEFIELKPPVRYLIQEN